MKAGRKSADSLAGPYTCEAMGRRDCIAHTCARAEEESDGRTQAGLTGKVPTMVEAWCVTRVAMNGADFGGSRWQHPKMNVVLEGRLLWLDGQWRFEGVWATDVKKKPSEKLPFTSAALLLPGLVRGVCMRASCLCGLAATARQPPPPPPFHPRACAPL